MKLALALFAISSSAIAQTGATPATPAKPVVHHAASSSSANPVSTIPKIVGVPRTLYALKYVDIKLGTGALAETHKWYTVNYTGWFPDGKKFDSSFDHGDTFTFPDGAQKVIIGWDTGFEGMRIGGKRRLFVPYQLAYGALGRPPQMPAKANLIFDVELLAISDKPPAPKTPPSPPAGAAKPAGAPPTPPATPPAGTPPPAAAPTTPPAPAKPATPPTK